jgi:hypothetical protein
MVKRTFVRIACLLGIVGVLAASDVTATPGSNRTTYFTFSTPVRLPGTVLTPGTYVFDRMSVVDPTLVRVTNRKTFKHHLLAFTRLVHRPSGGNLNPTLALGEAMKGAPPPITVWFPQGETLGYQFIY